MVKLKSEDSDTTPRDTADDASESGSQSRGVVGLLKRIAAFCLGIVIKYILGILINEEEDNFVTRIRKLCMGTFFVALIVMPVVSYSMTAWTLFAYYSDSEYDDWPVPYGLYACMISVTFFVIATSTTFLYAKCRNNNCPIWLLDVQVGCSLVVIAGLFVSLNAYPAEAIFLSVGMLYVWSFTPRAPFLAFVCLLLSLLHTYSVSFCGQFMDNRNYYPDNATIPAGLVSMFGHYRSENFVFRLPNSYEGDSKTYFNSTSNAFTTSLLAVATSAILILQYEAASRNAARGVDLAKEVTKQLLKYDTDGVRATVLAYQASDRRRRARHTTSTKEDEDDARATGEPFHRADKHDATALLADSFLNMAENLDRYRPHLPNWILKAASDEQDEDDEANEVPLSAVADDTGDAKNVRRSHCAIFDLDEEDQIPPVTAAPNDEDYGVASLLAQLQQDQHTLVVPPHGGGSEGHGRPRRGSRSSSIASSSCSTATGASCAEPHRSASALPGTSRVIPDRVCLVLLEYDVELLESALIASSLPNGPERFNGFVERVYELVNEHGGAVHSFVLQRITVSFNGVSRVEDPEMRAVRFVDALFREYPSLMSHDEATGALLQSALSVAVSSGRVEDCGVVSTNNDENRSFILSPLSTDSSKAAYGSVTGWFIELEQMLGFAQRSSVASIVVSQKVSQRVLNVIGPKNNDNLLLDREERFVFSAIDEEKSSGDEELLSSWHDHHDLEEPSSPSSFLFLLLKHDG